MNLNQLPNQRDNEKVVIFMRRHWFAVLTIIVAFFFLNTIPLAIGFYFRDTLSIWMQSQVTGSLITVIGSMYLLAVWLLAFIEFTDYYLDTWIVTTERIISIEQEGLFYRTASELDLAAVQDATAEIRGILQTVFTYGNVYVQTAGEKGRFVFKNINNPEHVKELVTRLVEDDKKRLSALGAGGRGKIKSTIK